MCSTAKLNFFERRNDHRHLYRGHVLFATRNGLQEGQLVNYSHSGLFIKSDQMLTAGELITIAVPYIQSDNDKRKAIVIWSNSRGIGVKFVTVH